jgi:hypothetical protein
VTTEHQVEDIITQARATAIRMPLEVQGAIVDMMKAMERMYLAGRADERVALAREFEHYEDTQWHANHGRMSSRLWIEDVVEMILNGVR